MESVYRQPALIGETTTIRHAVAEFDEWVRTEHLEGVRPRTHDGMVWLTQTSLAALFGCTSTNVATHLKKVFAQGDLVEDVAMKKMVSRASDGKRCTPRYYNLDVAVSLSYRICTEPSARFLVKTNDVLMDCTYRKFDRRDIVAERNRMVAKDAELGDGYFAKQRERHERVRGMGASFSERIHELFSTAVDYEAGVHEMPASFADADAWADQESMDKVVGYYVHYATTLDDLGIAVSMEDWIAIMGPLASHRADELAGCTVKVVHDIGRAMIEHEYGYFQKLHGRTYATEFDEFMTLLLAQEKKNDMLWLA